MKKNILNFFTNEKISNSVKSCVSFSFVLLSVMLLTRIFFGIELLIRTNVEWFDFFIVLSGFIYDVLLAANVFAVVFIPFVCLHYFFPRITAALTGIGIVFYALVMAFLSEYFCNTLSPLDQVVFAYTPQESVDAVLSSVSFSFVQVLFPLLALIASVLLIVFVKPSLKLKFSWLYVVFSVVLAGGVNYASLVRNEMFYNSHKNFLKATNQLSYPLITIVDYFNEERIPFTQESVSRVAKQYHALNHDKTYVDNQYPFWRNADDPDVLGRFLNKTTNGKLPNVVFIIVEGLGQRITGVEKPHYSFTPFLDSLSECGLYWKNCVSSAQRTFGVLPAVFASVPQGKYGFADYRNPMPDHNSLLKDFAKNDYYISFFYGGSASFSGQDVFMKTNKVSYVSDITIEKMSGKTASQHKGFNRWGVDDADLFAFAKKKKQEQKNVPFVDVYLTLSTHEPFNFPGREKYKQQILEKYELDDSEEAEKIRENPNIFASFLYLDDCLRQLFSYYKTRSDYENTIFVITGDHRIAPLDDKDNPLEKFTVPLIVYSPLQKTTKTMRGVVSHYDITPSIEAFLRGNYAFKVDSHCHWIGNAFDTSANFRCNKKQAFMLNNRSVVTFLSDSLLFDCGRLFVVKDGLLTERVRNYELRDSLKRQLALYQMLSEYAVNSNYLKPQDSIETLQLCALFNDFEQDGSITLQGEQNTWKQIDSLQEYTTLASFVLPKNCKGIVCDMSLKVKGLNGLKNLPYVVFQTKKSKRYFMQRPMVDYSGNTLNSGKSEVFSCRMFVPFDTDGITQDDIFEVYLWNNQKTKCLIDNVKITVFEKR